MLSDRRDRNDFTIILVLDQTIYAEKNNSLNLCWRVKNSILLDEIIIGKS